MSVELRRKALVRVRMTHPELQPVDVKLRSTTFIDRGGPVIEISSVSTEPAYPAALINELMSERIAELERAREQTASYQAYWAASTPVLLAQREAGNLRKKLDSLPQDPSTSLARDSISAELEDAQKRWELAKDALAPLPPESERPVIMYANARSEPYEHALDPLTLVLHHPWRALTSLAVAVFLARFLVPKYRGAFVGTPSHEMAPS